MTDKTEQMVEHIEGLVLQSDVPEHIESLTRALSTLNYIQRDWLEFFSREELQEKSKAPSTTYGQYTWEVVQPEMYGGDPLGQRGLLYVNGECVGALTDKFESFDSCPRPSKEYADSALKRSKE